MSEEINLAQQTTALDKVESLAAKLGAAEEMLEAGYAQFAEALLIVQRNRYWESTHESWGAYFNSIIEKYHMGKKQLYHKVAVVRELEGVVNAADLTTMGISKASVLADIHRVAQTLPDEAITSALDPKKTARELKQELAACLNLPAEEEGIWLDLDYAFYVTEEEKTVLLEAERILRGIDPPISNTLKASAQKKQVALRMAMEILGTYGEPDEKEGF